MKLSVDVAEMSGSPLTFELCRFQYQHPIFGTFVVVGGWSKIGTALIDERTW